MAAPPPNSSCRRKWPTLPSSCNRHRRRRRLTQRVGAPGAGLLVAARPAVAALAVALHQAWGMAVCHLRCHLGLAVALAVSWATREVTRDTQGMDMDMGMAARPTRGTQATAPCPCRCPCTCKCRCRWEGAAAVTAAAAAPAATLATLTLGTPEVQAVPVLTSTATQAMLATLGTLGMLAPCTLATRAPDLRGHTVAGSRHRAPQAAGADQAAPLALARLRTHTRRPRRATSDQGQADQADRVDQAGTLILTPTRIPAQQALAGRRCQQAHSLCL